MNFTPAMDEALQLIRTQTVFYTYRPLPRSVDRPLPVRPRDLTPVYSHGLHASTVGALERRGLVTLASHSLRHGRVLAVEPEED